MGTEAQQMRNGSNQYNRLHRLKGIVMKPQKEIITKGRYTALIVKGQSNAIYWIRNDAAGEWVRSGAFDYATRYELNTLPDAVQRCNQLHSERR